MAHLQHEPMAPTVAASKARSALRKRLHLQDGRMLFLFVPMGARRLSIRPILEDDLPG